MRRNSFVQLLFAAIIVIFIIIVLAINWMLPVGYTNGAKRVVGSGTDNNYATPNLRKGHEPKPSFKDGTFVPTILDSHFDRGQYVPLDDNIKSSRRWNDQPDPVAIASGEADAGLFYAKSADFKQHVEYEESASRAYPIFVDEPERVTVDRPFDPMMYKYPMYGEDDDMLDFRPITSRKRESWDVVKTLKSMLTEGRPTDNFMKPLIGGQRNAKLQEYQRAIQEFPSTKSPIDAIAVLDKDKMCKNQWKAIAKMILQTESSRRNQTRIGINLGDSHRSHFTFVEFDGAVSESFAFIYSEDNKGFDQKKKEKSELISAAAKLSRIQGCLSIRATHTFTQATSFFMGGSKMDPRVTQHEKEREAAAHRSAVNLRDEILEKTMQHFFLRANVDRSSIRFFEGQRDHFDYQVIHGLSGLSVSKDVNDLIQDNGKHWDGALLLHHEFETLLGRLLTLSSVTFLPQHLPEETYFDYWGSMRRLIERASENAAINAIIEPEKSGEFFQVSVLLSNANQQGINEYPLSIYARRAEKGPSLHTLLNLGLCERDRNYLFHEIITHPVIYHNRSDDDPAVEDEEEIISQRLSLQPLQLVNVPQHVQVHSGHLFYKPDVGSSSLSEVPSLSLLGSKRTSLDLFESRSISSTDGPLDDDLERKQKQQNDGPRLAAPQSSLRGKDGGDEEEGELPLDQGRHMYTADSEVEVGRESASLPKERESTGSDIIGAGLYNYTFSDHVTSLQDSLSLDIRNIQETMENIQDDIAPRHTRNTTLTKGLGEEEELNENFAELLGEFFGDYINDDQGLPSIPLDHDNQISSTRSGMGNDSLEDRQSVDIGIGYGGLGIDGENNGDDLAPPIISSRRLRELPSDTSHSVVSRNFAFGLNGEEMAELRKKRSGSTESIVKIPKRQRGHVHRLLEREKFSVKRWWSLFQNEGCRDEIVGAQRRLEDASSLLVLGRDMGVFSVKVASTARTAIVTAVGARSDDWFAREGLSKLFNVHNENILNCRGFAGGGIGIDHEIAEVIRRSNMRRGHPERLSYRYAFIGVDIFTALLRFASSKDVDQIDIGFKFEQMLGDILSMSATTFVEVPEWAVLRVALDILVPFSGTALEKEYKMIMEQDDSLRNPTDDQPPHDIFKAIFGSAANTAGFKATLRFTSQNNEFAKSTLNARIHRNRQRRQDKASDDIPKEYYDPQNELHRALDMMKQSPFTRILRVDISSWAAKQGTSTKEEHRPSYPLLPNVFSLLQLGVTGTDRARIFRQYVRVPHHFTSSNVLVSPLSLAGDSISLHLLDPTDLRLKEVPRYSHEAVLDALEDTAMTGFSFVEFFGDRSWEEGRNKGLSMLVADKYPLATVLSISDSQEFTNVQMNTLEEYSNGLPALGRTSYNLSYSNQVERIRGANTLICKTAIDADIFNDIYESPEMFRYQVFSLPLLDAMLEFDTSALQKMMGNFLSTGVTSFVHLPTEEGLKNAFGVFAASAQLGRTHYYEHDFGISAFAELLSEGAVLSALTRVRSSSNDKTSIALRRIHLTSSGESFNVGDPTTLLRVDLTNLTRHVHHHYGWRKDGHKRTYMMRVERSKDALRQFQRANAPNKQETLKALAEEGFHPSHGGNKGSFSFTRVALTRLEDGSAIPYTR